MSLVNLSIESGKNKKQIIDSKLNRNKIKNEKNI